MAAERQYGTELLTPFSAQLLTLCSNFTDIANPTKWNEIEKSFQNGNAQYANAFAYWKKVVPVYASRLSQEPVSDQIAALALEIDDLLALQFGNARRSPIGYGIEMLFGAVLAEKGGLISRQESAGNINTKISLPEVLQQLPPELIHAEMPTRTEGKLDRFNGRLASSTPSGRGYEESALYQFADKAINHIAFSGSLGLGSLKDFVHGIGDKIVEALSRRDQN